MAKKDISSEEFWKIYKELEDNPKLARTISAASKLTPEDLNELIEYAKWLKEERKVIDCL